MTRHQRLTRNMRNPGRLARRRKNRRHRVARQKAREEFAAWLEREARARRIMWDEMIGMQVQRPQAIAVVTSV